MIAGEPVALLKPKLRREAMKAAGSPPNCGDQLSDYPRFEVDGWCYQDRPVEGDARKFVTLIDGGMKWIGIRAYHFQEKRWMNNGEPERADVLAWRDLPKIAEGFWDRGKLWIISK